MAPNSTLIINKPADSRIKLNQCKEYLEVNIPRSYWRYPNIIVIIALGILYVMLLSFFIKFGSELISLPFLIWIIIILLFPISIIIFFIYSNAILKIDSQQICLTYKLLGIKWNYPKPKPSNYINKLVYAPEIQHSWLNSKLTIWAGVHKFCLIDCNSLVPRCSETETEWLAYELSEWLGIPITREEYLK